MKMHPSNYKGFSLVELSIVLVIIGLLVGGVLAGKSMIHASELRAVTQEHNRLVAAFAGFRDKYFGIPGDITNATSFWGIAAGTTGNDATCRVAASTDQKTCNGNGDGMIAQSTGSYENYRFIQQLANAGFIEGSYSGVIINPNKVYPQVNAMGSKFDPRAFWMAYYTASPVSAHASAFDGMYNNYIYIHNRIGNGDAAVFIPEDAYNLDMKMDDGMPGTGRVISQWLTCTTAASGADLTAEYDVTNTNVVCWLAFLRTIN